MLDRQLQLSRSAAELAAHTLEVMQAQKDFGRAMESSVQSARANLHQVEASIPEIERRSPRRRMRWPSSSASRLVP